MKDNFSEQAEQYASFRPGYPEELFDFIFSLCKIKHLAWDCGTGNGQCAVNLASQFEKVYATDISEEQLRNAPLFKNIIYQKESADRTELTSGTVNLITVAQALHWFPLTDFYNEVARVATVDAVIVAWTYSLLQTDIVTDIIINELYSVTLNEYWDPERKYVDEQYETIQFPFRNIATPVMNIQLQWTPDQLSGYLNTWSAVKKYIKLNNRNPVSTVMDKIQFQWPPNETRRITFPLHIKAGYVH